MTPYPNDPKRGGFTLLEVLVAVAVFALGAVSVLAVRSNSFREARAARDFNVSRYLLQQQIEHIMLFPEDYEDGDEGSFEDEEDPQIIDRYTWRVEIEEIDLIGGGDDDEEDEGFTRRATRSDRDDQEDGGGGFGGDGEETEIQVWRVTLYIEYPARNGELTHVSATTYLPGETWESDDLF